MIDLLALLREARELADDRHEEELANRLLVAIAEHEVAPERKCGTCWYWVRHIEFEVGDCQSGDAAEHATVDRTHENFGCRFWEQRKETT